MITEHTEHTEIHGLKSAVIRVLRVFRDLKHFIHLLSGIMRIDSREMRVVPQKPYPAICCFYGYKEKGWM